MGLLQRLTAFITKPAADPATAALYRACIAQARQPAFYAELGVPDSVDGRFDLLLLHVVLIMRRLGDNRTMKQSLFDLMFADMDRSLREMGVGDMSISKKIRPMVQAFYGRAQAYEKALAEGDDALTAALQRNLYGRASADADHLKQLVTYVHRAVVALDVQSIDRMMSDGSVVFPAVL